MTCYHCGLKTFAGQRAQQLRMKADGVAAERRSYAAKREELRQQGALHRFLELGELQACLELLGAEEQALREQAAAWQQQADQMSCPRHARRSPSIT